MACNHNDKNYGYRTVKKKEKIEQQKRKLKKT